MEKHRLISIGVAVLAIVQGLFGVSRGFDYVRMGGEVAARGIILRPLLGAVAYGRGILVILTALLSFIFHSNGNHRRNHHNSSSNRQRTNHLVAKPLRRKAMFRNMANSVIVLEQIVTTVQKAKEILRVVNRLITLVK